MCVCVSICGCKVVGLRVHVFFGSVCKESVSVWVKSGKAWSLSSDTKQKKNMFTFFHCESGVLWLRLWQSCVSWSVVCVILWVQSGFSG